MSIGKIQYTVDMDEIIQLVKLGCEIRFVAHVIAPYGVVFIDALVFMPARGDVPRYPRIHRFNAVEIKTALDDFLCRVRCDMMAS